MGLNKGKVNSHQEFRKGSFTGHFVRIFVWHDLLLGIKTRGVRSCRIFPWVLSHPEP